MRLLQTPQLRHCLSRDCAAANCCGSRDCADSDCAAADERGPRNCFCGNTTSTYFAATVLLLKEYLALIIDYITNYSTT